MSRRSILLLNQYYPPDTAATATMAELVATVLAERYRVTVLAGRPSYDPAERYPWALSRRVRQGNVTVERVGSTAFPRYRMAQRVANYLSYLALALPRALVVDTDAVLAMTDPPIAGIIGALVARLRRCPFIYNIRDLYPDMALASGVVPQTRWTAGWERAHRWALRQADRVIVLGEDMRERIVAKGIPRERVAVVRDGGQISDSPASRDHPVAREIRGEFRFVLLHAGNLGFYGAWETVVRAARALESEGVGLVFVGGGAARGQLETLARGCRAVRFLPYRPVEQVPYVLAAGDLHVITVRRGLEGVVVPSKLYGVLAAGRPVLAVAPPGSDVARIVDRFRCGYVVDPEDPQAVVAAVRQALASPEHLLSMGERARAAASCFDRAGELRRFVQCVQEVVAEECRQR